MQNTMLWLIHWFLILAVKLSCLQKQFSHLMCQYTPLFFFFFLNVSVCSRNFSDTYAYSSWAKPTTPVGCSTTSWHSCTQRTAWKYYEGRCAFFVVTESCLAANPAAVAELWCSNANAGRVQRRATATWSARRAPAPTRCQPRRRAAAAAAAKLLPATKASREAGARSGSSSSSSNPSPPTIVSRWLIRYIYASLTETHPVHHSHTMLRSHFCLSECLTKWTLLILRADL